MMGRAYCILLAIGLVGLGSVLVASEVKLPAKLTEIEAERMIAASLMDGSYPQLIAALDRAADKNPNSFAHQYAAGLGFLAVMRASYYGGMRDVDWRLTDPGRAALRLDRAHALDKASGSGYAALCVLATMHRPVGIAPAETVRLPDQRSPNGMPIRVYRTISDRPLRDHMRDLILSGLKVNSNNPRLRYLEALRGGESADQVRSAQGIKSAYNQLDSPFWRALMLDSLYFRVEGSRSAAVKVMADRMFADYVKLHGRSPLLGRLRQR